MKEANRIILAAKCQVVRDAQVKEKQELRQLQRNEDSELEKLMLDENERALAKEKQSQFELKKTKEQYATDLRQQLSSSHAKRLLEARRIKEEANAMSRAEEAILKEHLMKQREKNMKKERLRREYEKSKEISVFYKTVAYEKERNAEIKSQEFLRKVREREMQYQREKRLEKESKQREIDRLLGLQSRLLNEKNEQEFMAMRRIQEQKEREFRQREREAAQKRKDFQEQILHARENQKLELRREEQARLATVKKEYDNIINELNMIAKHEEKEKVKKIERKETYKNGESLFSWMESNSFKFFAYFEQI